MQQKCETYSLIHNSIQSNSCVYFRHKKSIYYKIYIHVVKIKIMMYNNAIQSIRTRKKVILKKTYIYIYIYNDTSRTTNSKFLRRWNRRVTNRCQYRIIRKNQPINKTEYIFPQYFTEWPKIKLHEHLTCTVIFGYAQ